MMRQSWSLQQRHVPFALFSRYVEEDEKSAMAAKLVTLLPPIPPSADGEITPLPTIPPFRWATKPAFPDLKSGTLTRLSHFIGIESLILFSRAVKDWRWLLLAPTDWPTNDAYKEALAVVRGIAGTNEPAERLCAVAKRFSVRWLPISKRLPIESRKHGTLSQLFYIYFKR